MTSAVFVRFVKLINSVFFTTEAIPSSMKVKSVKYTPRKGMHGACALLRASLYRLKFFVLAMSVLMLSRSSFVLVGSWAQVRFNRRIGAVPKADTTAVKEEKLFKKRHFYIC